MKKTIIIQILISFVIIPLCAQDDVPYAEIDTTLVFQKDWFNLQGQYKEVKGQKWLINKICSEGVQYTSCSDYTSFAPNLPWYLVKIHLPDGIECDTIEVVCNGSNLFSAGYRLSPGYFMPSDEPQERKDSMFLAMQTYQYEYARYPEQQVRLINIAVDRVDEQQNPISYSASIMVTPFQYDTAQELIIFHPRIRLSLRLKKTTNNEPTSTISFTTMANGKSFNDKCFDLAGRRLTAPPVKGVYIKDGKKVTR